MSILLIPLYEGKSTSTSPVFTNPSPALRASKLSIGGPSPLVHNQTLVEEAATELGGLPAS